MTQTSPQDTEGATEDSQEAPRKKVPLSAVVDRVAHYLHQVLSPGELAELRRMSPRDASCPALWRVLVSVVEPTGWYDDTDRRSDKVERAWGTILAGMAHMPGLHRKDTPVGQAAAQAGLSELRLTRLLRARGDAIRDGVLTLARYLGAKRQPVRWTDMARLVLFPDDETVRRQIARDYFGRLYRGADKRSEG